MRPYQHLVGQQMRRIKNYLKVGRIFKKKPRGIATLKPTKVRLLFALTSLSRL